MNDLMFPRRDLLLGLAALAASPLLRAQTAGSPPKIAVTELAYQEQVREYFDVTTIKHKTEEQSRLQARDSLTSSSMSGARSSREELDATRVTGAYSYIQQGELRHFTSDLKGLILKGSGARLVQGS